MSNQTPDTMWKALIYKPYDIRVEKVPTPTPGPLEIRVRVTKATVYGTDLKFYRGQLPRNFDESRYPIGFGAECAGVVDAIGEGVTTLKVGERVAPIGVWFCGQCYYCLNGRVNLCVEVIDSMDHRNEAFQQYCVVKEHVCMKIADNVADDDAACLGGLNMGMSTFDLMPPIAVGAEIVVIGLGAMGIGIVNVGAALGYEVVAMHTNHGRDEFAKKFGAKYIATSAEELQKYPWKNELGPVAVIDAAGTPEVGEMALDIAMRGGAVATIGSMAWGWPNQKILHRELSVQAIRSGHTNQQALDLVASGKAGLGETIAKNFNLMDLAAALASLDTDRTSIRLGVDYDNL